MNFSDFQERSRRTLNMKLGANDAIANYAMGLAGEAGETADYLKKILFHGHEMNIEKVVEEVGDVLFYCAALGTVMGFDLGEAAEANIRKLMKRYPEGFSQEKSRER